MWTRVPGLSATHLQPWPGHTLMWTRSPDPLSPTPAALAGTHAAVDSGPGLSASSPLVWQLTRIWAEGQG